MLALCQSVSRETHKIRQSGSSVRVGDAQFHQIHRSTALHELVLAPSLTPQAPAALASHASLFTPLKATGYCNDTLSHEPQTAAAAHSAAARHSRSVSSTKTRARTLARSSSVRTAHVLLCAASRDTANIFWVEPNVVGVVCILCIVTLLCGGRVKEPTARTGFQSAHAADRA